MPTISMTWPQYLRGECTFDGMTVALKRRHAELLLLLLLRRGQIVSLAELVHWMWPHPDEEPGHPEDAAANYIREIHTSLPGVVLTDHGRGRIIPLP